ncbi:MAG TPA: peptidoglycan DD-metalloendopeptidase family protein [Bacteroidales bacterium]|nr:peptidoglycan DD-metalloendopeptidase family protein [Bacteroidales bacterium]
MHIFQHVPGKNPVFLTMNKVLCCIVPVILLCLTACSWDKNQAPGTVPVPTAAERKNVSLLFGIPADSFNIIRGKIRPNSFLADILKNYGISSTETDAILKNSGGIFDVRAMRANSSFTAFTSRDNLPRLRYFVYESDPTLFYIFSFNDSLHIYPYRVNPVTQIRHASLTIETSLWDALMSKGLSPELAVDLSDIYAWTIDFFGLQKGDNFKFVYEENFIDDKSIGTGRILCALYNSPEKHVFAFPMIQDDKESYYDSNGNSLRKEFLKAPLHFTHIASRFSSARMHPILRIVRPHYGVDYGAPAGTPVYSIGDGTVISATSEQEPGNIVRIRHNSVYTTAYMHLSGFAKGIRGGVKVKQGDVIGYVGSTGLATGPHLDFRFYKNGYPVDPLRVEAPPVEPVREENLEKYARIRSVMTGLLNSFN